MTRVTLDADAASRLFQLTYTVELCDPSGKVLGQFVPAADLSEWEPMIADVSEAELDRRERSDERRFTTADVIAHLEQL